MQKGRKVVSKLAEGGHVTREVRVSVRNEVHESRGTVQQIDQGAQPETNNADRDPDDIPAAHDSVCPMTMKYLTKRVLERLPKFADVVGQNSMSVSRYLAIRSNMKSCTRASLPAPHFACQRRTELPGQGATAIWIVAETLATTEQPALSLRPVMTIMLVIDWTNQHATAVNRNRRRNQYGLGLELWAVALMSDASWSEPLLTAVLGGDSGVLVELLMRDQKRLNRIVTFRMDSPHQVLHSLKETPSRRSVSLRPTIPPLVSATNDGVELWHPTRGVAFLPSR